MHCGQTCPIGTGKLTSGMGPVSGRVRGGVSRILLYSDDGFTVGAVGGCGQTLGFRGLCPSSLPPRWPVGLVPPHQSPGCHLSKVVCCGKEKDPRL